MKSPTFIQSMLKKFGAWSAPQKIVAITGALLLLFGVIYFVSPEPIEADSPYEGVYKIKSNYSGKYITVDQSSGDVKLYNWHDTNLDQLFTIEEGKDGYKKIRNANSYLVLDLYGENNKENERVVQFEDKDKTNQQFEIQEQEGGFVKIKVRHSGQYLTIKSDSRDEGAQLVQYPFKTSGVNNQDWTLEKVQPFASLQEYLLFRYEVMGDNKVSRVVEGAKIFGFTEDPKTIEDAYWAVIADHRPKPEKYYRIKSAYNDLYMGIRYNEYGEGVHVQQMKWYQSNLLGMTFRFVPSETVNFYSIVSVQSNKTFTVEGESKNENAPILQNTFNGSHNQLFRVEYNKNGIYKLKAWHSGKYLTVKSDSRNEWEWIVQYPYKTSGVNNQEWYLEEVDMPFKDLDGLLEKRIFEDSALTTDLLLTNAKGMGYDTDAKTIEDKVDKLLDTNASRVFADGTGFITTFGMLNKTIDQIGFAGAHNAFSNNQDRRSSLAWDTYKTGHDLGTENHNISIQTMLEKGYRVIDLDIGNDGSGHTGCYHRYRLAGYSNLYGGNAILPKIRTFLDLNPSEIAIIHLSDVYNGTVDLTKLKNSSIYHKGEDAYYNQVNNLILNIRDSGFLDKLYNYTGDGKGDDLYKDIKIPGKDIPWPTLKEMIQSNKQLLFLERDTGISKDIGFKNQNGDPNNTTAENLNIPQDLLDDLKGGSAKKIINVTCTEDWGASAGDMNAAKINNNGKRIYEIVKKADSTLKDNDIKKLVNVLYVDYATGNTKQGGWIDVSPVDAMNRANFDYFGYPWEKDAVGRFYWE